MVVLTEQHKKLGIEWWKSAKKFFPKHAEFIDEVIKEFEMYEAVQELKELIVEGIKY